MKALDGVVGTLLVLAFISYAVDGEWDTAVWVAIATMWWGFATAERALR